MATRKITDIVVRDRVRQDYGNIDALVASIKNNGLIQPIAVDTDNVLVAGGRRLKAVTKLGWTHVEVQLVECAGDLMKALDAEVAENVCRLDFTPMEAAKARMLRTDLLRDMAKKNQAAAGPATGRGAKPTASGKLPKAVTWTEPPLPVATAAQNEQRLATIDAQPIDTRAIASKGLGYSPRTLDKVDEIVAAAADETLPEPVREVAKQAVAQVERTGKVDGAHKALKRAEYEESPIGKFMTSVNEDPEIRKLDIEIAINKGCAASHRGLIAWDPEIVGEALDASTFEILDSHIALLVDWHRKVHAARPKSIRLVKES